MPPSAVTIEPVMYDASSDARKAITLAISSGLPGPIGTHRLVSAMVSRRSFGVAVAILASALAAASARPSSPWRLTQRAPSTSASSSSGLNISGGRNSPARIL